MRPRRTIGAWIGGLFGANRFDKEMDEELRAHLDFRTEKNIATGMLPEEAHFAALRSFGGLEQIKERSRDQRRGTWIAQLIQDLRIGLRMLRKSPVFTTISVLSLAIGIGAATAVFSLVDAILLGSLRVPNPQDLRVVCWTATATNYWSYSSNGDPVVPGRKAGASFSVGVFDSLRTQCASLADIVGFQTFYGTARGKGEAAGVQGIVVSGNFFSSLGVHPLLGTLLGPEDEKAGAPLRTVISYSFWEKQFGLDPGAVGQQVVLNGAIFTVAGIMPRGFMGITPGNNLEVYAPFSARSQLMPMWRLDQENPNNWWISLMGRLKPGVGSSQFKAALDVALIAAAGNCLSKPEALVTDGRDGPVWDRKEYKEQLQLLLAVVAVVVLLACANVGGLLRLAGWVGVTSLEHRAIRVDGVRCGAPNTRIRNPNSAWGGAKAVGHSDSSTGPRARLRWHWGGASLDSRLDQGHPRQTLRRQFDRSRNIVGRYHFANSCCSRGRMGAGTPGYEDRPDGGAQVRLAARHESYQKVARGSSKTKN